MSKCKIELLSNEDIMNIHIASLEILRKMGVRIKHRKVVDTLISAGATTDTTGEVLFLSAALIEKCLSSCPPIVKLVNRANDERLIGPDGDQIYFTSNALHWVDERNEVREITSGCFSDYMRIVDSLDHVFAAVGVNICDLPVATRDVSGFRIMLQNTHKHIRPCLYTPEGVNEILKMSEVILDGRPYTEFPFFSFGYTITSPLKWSEEACEVFIRSSGRKIPMMINAEPLAGGTSPVTLSGSIALANAEVLSGIVISQLLEPGRPLIYNIGIAHVLDMSSAISLTGAPENSLMAAAGANIAAFYNLPSASWMNTDALAIDAQAIMEKTQAIHVHSMAGVNMIWGVGNMESTLSYSPVMAIIDNEIIGSVQRLKRGIEVDEEHLALDEILNVGFSGNFLSTEHTYQHFRSQLRMSKLSNRVQRENWTGKKLEEKAMDYMTDIKNNEAKMYISQNQYDHIMSIENQWIRRINANA